MATTALPCDHGHEDTYRTSTLRLINIIQDDCYFLFQEWDVFGELKENIGNKVECSLLWCEDTNFIYIQAKIY